MNEENFPIEPPESDYVSETYVLKVPSTAKYLENPGQLKAHAVKLLEKKIGDEVEVTSLKVKKPTPSSRVKAKLFKRVPEARLFVTVRF